MANFINKYTNIEAYNADEGKQYPNVSYLVATDEVKWVKDDPVHIVCKYNVTSTESATKLLNSNSNIAYQIIDGIKQDAVQTSYIFDTLGEHIVKYKLSGTSISDYAFSSCTGLTSVTIPDSVTSIGNSAFYNCTGLTSVTIGSGVTSIGQSAFNRCTGLTSIVVDSANTVFDSRDNCNALIKTSTNELITGCKNTVIPDTVTSIGSSAFYYCTGLTSITIPDSVTSIGNYAFGYCTSLTSITIPDSVTKISDSAFESCKGLTSVTIGSGVTSIGRAAFNGCNSLTSVTINATTPPTLGIMAFNFTNNCPIYCPVESLEAYKTATNWSSLASRIKPIS